MADRDTISEMLMKDIGLKQAIAQILNIHARKQTVILILVSVCTVALMALFMFYITRPNPVDRMVFQAIQHERSLIKQEREVLRIERDSLRQERKRLIKLK